MPVKYTPVGTSFGLLPEPESRPGSFIASMAINGLIFGLAIYVGAAARKIIQEHKYEQTELIIPATPPPAEKVKLPEPPKIKLPDMPEVKLEAPMINRPKPEPKPDLKPIQLEAKVALPAIKEAKPAVILAPQPHAALTAAMPAQNNHVKPSTAPVHLGQTFGVTPNPYATRPATVASIGNPYGGLQGPAVAPHGVVGSTGIGNGLKSGSNAGVVGKVASAGIPGATGKAATGYAGGKVASAGIPGVVKAVAAQKMVERPVFTTIEVVLRVTFTAAGHVVVQSVMHGLGHGLDEEARRVAQQIHFRPATRNGQAVDSTTTITITFQLA
jgi:TonB family protein